MVIKLELEIILPEVK